MTRRPAAEILAALDGLGIRLDLEPFRGLLVELDSPGDGLPAVLVAGTNGKGSVATLLTSIAEQAGLRTGLYTSPHLERWSERILVGGTEISDQRLATHLRRAVAAARAGGLPPPTPFEAMTAAALLEFRRQNVDLAILEVGLGGRLDATNAVEPLLSIVTRIALDHQEYLGGSLVQIAAEKAGIFRPGVPALAAPQSPAVATALTGAAAALGAPCILVSESASFSATESLGLAGSSATLATPVATYSLVVGLAGEHQLENVATAVRGAELLAQRWPVLAGEAIRRGVAAARWPGRLEAIRLAGGRQLLLDAAHNPDGCAALNRFLEQLRQPYVLLFGALRDKAVAKMLPALASAAAAVVLTRPDSPRALAAEELAGLCAGGPPPQIDNQPESALERAVEIATANGVDLVVACGSIYLVGPLRRKVSAALAGGATQL